MRRIKCKERRLISRNTSIKKTRIDEESCFSGLRLTSCISPIQPRAAQRPRYDVTSLVPDDFANNGHNLVLLQQQQQQKDKKLQICEDLFGMCDVLLQRDNGFCVVDVLMFYLLSFSFI